MPNETGRVMGGGTGNVWWDHPRHATPWLPEDPDHTLINLAVEVIAASARLEGALPQPGRSAVAMLLRYVNSYYTNLIEGHNTLPRDIERAMRKEYCDDPTKRNHQIEARVHVEVERRMRLRLAADSTQNVASLNFLSRLHREFFHALPEELRTMRRGETGPEVQVMPGSLRTEEVEIGHHDPPTHVSLPLFMDEFAQQYDPTRLSRAQMVIAAAASHHRLLWIHPFADGNGRVARLFAQAYLIRAGVDAHASWSISRGLARRNKDYRKALADADVQRAGDLDGRGQLSNAGLHAFCRYFLEVALDQINFIGGLLKLDNLLDRLASMADDAERRKTLPPRTGLVLREALLRGPLSRGEALQLFGQAERTSRQHLAAVLKSGLLIPEGLTHRSPVSFAIPAAYGTHLFPDLYPINRADTNQDEQEEPGLITKLRSMSSTGLRDAIDSLLCDHMQKLVMTDEVGSLIAETNAVGYGVDDWGLESDGDIDLSSDEEARVAVRFHVTGESDPDADRPFAGDTIVGTATVVIAAEGHITFDDVRGSIKPWWDKTDDASDQRLEGDD